MIKVEFHSVDSDKIALIRKFATCLSGYKRITGGYGTITCCVGQYRFSLDRVPVVKYVNKEKKKI